MKDPYRVTAGFYDRIFDSINKGLRLVGIMMFRPSNGMNILDIGCGTGSHLELYQRYKCHLFGIDSSPAMLAIARKRLGETAQLDLCNATEIPYEDQKFDLIISMLSLHEMSQETQSGVFREMKRLLKKKGRILLIDFKPGPLEFYQGWVSKTIIVISELAAGRKHFKNYRHFMSTGGLTALVDQQNLQVDNQKILAGGTFAVMLVKS